MILVSDCISHNVHIWNVFWIQVSKDIRLLRYRIPSIVIPRKRVEWPNNMPSCTELSCCVQHESTNVRSSQRNSQYVVHHYSRHWISHIFILWKIIAQPPWSKFSKTWESASLYNHCPFLFWLKPFVRSFSLLSSKQRMSINFFNTTKMSPFQWEWFWF